MCTVTALPGSWLDCDRTSDPLLLRVACNRDERLTRRPALPPTLWAAGPRRVLMPIDPDSGGTWLAASDSGLVFVLLNANPSHGGAGELSRGTIIPTLVGSESLTRAHALALALPAERFAPFRLVIMDRQNVVDCWPDGARIRHRRRALDRPLLRTSSSLGDSVVARPRRRLFQRLFDHATDPRRAQDVFHGHHWPGREAISVQMRRHDARTVSQSVVELREGSVTLSYRAIERSHAVAVEVAA